MEDTCYCGDSACFGVHSVNQFIDALRTESGTASFPCVTVVNVCRAADKAMIKPALLRMSSRESRESSKVENRIWTNKELLPDSSQNRHLCDPWSIYVVNAHGNVYSANYYRNLSDTFYILPAVTGTVLLHDHVYRILSVLDFLLGDGKGEEEKWDICHEYNPGLPNYKRAQAILGSWDPASQRRSIERVGRKRALWYSFLSRDNCGGSARGIIQRLTGLKVGELGSWAIYRPGDMMPDIGIHFKTSGEKVGKRLTFFRGGIDTLGEELGLPMLERARADYTNIRDAYYMSSNPRILRKRRHKLAFKYVVDPPFEGWPPTLVKQFSYPIGEAGDLEFPLFAPYKDYELDSLGSRLDLVPCEARCLPGSHIAGPECPEDPWDCELIEGCIRCAERSGKCTANPKPRRRRNLGQRSRKRMRRNKCRIRRSIRRSGR